MAGEEANEVDEQQDAKKRRSSQKSAFTRQANKVKQKIAEKDSVQVKLLITQLKEKFNNFETAHERFHDLLETDDQIEESDQYFFTVQSNYITVLNESHEFLERVDSGSHVDRKPPKVEQPTFDSKELIESLNMPKVAIPEFDGDPKLYHSFIAMFDEMVGRSKQNDDVKLTRLLQFTTGEAHKSIRSCVLMDKGVGYGHAREVLHERFGNVHLVTQHLINNLVDNKPVKNVDDLRAFYDELQNCSMILKQMGKIHEVQNQMYILQIAERLQPFIRNRWKRKALEIKKEISRYPSFEEFVEFVHDQTVQETDPVYGKAPVKKAAPKDARKSSAFTSNTSYGNQSVKGYKCVLCKNEHRLIHCQKFKDLKPADRLRVVTDNKLCHNCFYSNHSTADCRKTVGCEVPGCNARHNKFIHVSQQGGSSVENGATKSQVKLVNANSKVSNDVLMPVVAVKVNGNRETCAILDSGSTSSFCTQSLVDSLKVEGKQVIYSISTLNNSSTDVKTEVVDLHLTSLDGRESLKVSNVYVIDNIPFKSTCPIPGAYVHFRGLSLVDCGQDIELLLGQDNAEAFIPLEVRRGKKGEPFASKTLFGWAANGQNRIVEPVNKTVVSQFVSSSLSLDIDRLWRLENEGVIQDDKAWSVEDKRVASLWDEKVRLIDGHYELPIPWKENAYLPNNVGVATSRLKSLRSNLDKRGLFWKYDEEICKLLENGYAEAVPDGELCKEDKVWYLPHQAVVTDKKPDKLRVVFDCASKFQGESLNMKCLQGPNLTSKLHDVLLRFRQHQWAFTGDVTAMYNQVKIPVYDRDALRFLWDGDGILRHFRMTSHLFGGIWCASSATYALRRTALDFNAEKAVADTIQRAFYVDDCLKSVKSKEEVSRMSEGVKHVLSQAGFKLTKFVANHPDLLHDIPEEDRAKEVRDLSSLTCSKVLGVKWDTCQDTFFITVNVSEKDCISRKQMLSVIASCFDPLGLVSPMIVAGKLLFQAATRLKFGWDDDVPADILTEWNKWIVELQKLETLKIPRCVKPNLFDDAAVELHLFSDASLHAYGVCCYVRCINKRGEIHTALLVSKCKVAPIKSVTIPRLELQAAVLSVRMNSTLQRELDIQLNQSYFWVDSQLVLKYIGNETKRFQVYVGNRVGEIREHSDVAQWNFIPGKENPADVLTKPVRSLDSSKWFQGPEFLRSHKCDWNIVEIDCNLSDSDPDVKADVRVYATKGASCEKHPIDSIVEHFSSWYRVKRAVAWLLRLKTCLKMRTQNHGRLTVTELNAAEVLVLKHVQNQSFSKEVQDLSCGRPLHKASNVKNLSPFIGQDGLLRVGGRVTFDNDVDFQHPILIPHTHLVASRIALDCHNRAHLGTEWVLSDLRKKFWITRGRVIVKSVSRDCIVCKKLFAPTAEQKMADLPSERMEAFKAPFTYVGMDCFGPFYVRQGRSEVKRYGCVFTCMSIRAVHLEKLCSLDTDSLINAIRRFVARRGFPEKIFCDNGSNLVGASRELSRNLKELQTGRIHEYCVKNSIQWHFNPPLASHMGGVWERMIRTIRKVFAGIFNAKYRMTDETLDTIFCETECIVNSRPITKLNDDPNDCAFLCPNQLLLLKTTQLCPPCATDPSDVYKQRWKFVQHIADLFWKRFIQLYIPEIQRRAKWLNVRRNFQVGDLVLLKDENTPRYLWPLGLVIEVYKSSDNLVRSLKIKTKASQFVRPVTKVVLLEAAQ